MREKRTNMKKSLLIVTSVLLIILLSVYTLLFTSLGNNLLKPYLEAKINESSPVSLELSEFILRMDSLRILLVLDEKNTLLAKGDISIFDQSFDIDYEVALNELSTLRELAGKDISGSLLTQGKVQGDMDLFTIKGDSNVAKSDTKYTIVIQDLEVNKAAVKLTNARLQNLLKIAGEKDYANGNLDLHVQLHDLRPKQMKGSVSLNVKEAELNAKVLKKEFGLSLSRTALTSDLKATLEGEDIKYIFSLQSELVTLFSKGNLQADKKSINSNYKIDIKELALLKSITKTAIRGPFATQGEIQGDEKALFIKGKSDLAKSKTSYNVELKDLKPSRVIVNIKDASLEKLLYMAGEKSYAQAILNADIQLNNLDPSKLDGDTTIKLSKGKVNQKVMLKSFQVKLPQTTFNLDAKTQLKADNVNYKLSLNSNLAKITSIGDLKPNTLETKASYDVNIKELALLKPITDSALRGPLATSGKINGDKREMILKGNSNLAQSKTSYALVLKDLSPSSAKLSMKEAELSKLLYFSGQPDYAEGKLNLEADMSNLSSLAGKVTIDINKGLLHKTPIKKHFDINLPYTKFSLISRADIQENKLTAKSTLTSNLAILKMKKTSYDIETSMYDTDYDLFIPSLQRLEPILERKLYGELKANGEIKQDTKFRLTAHSNIFQGKLDAKIVDEKIDADFKNLHALDILKMLGYPEIMDAPLNGTFTYNTKTQKGELDSRFDKATLTPSKMTKLVNNFTRTDLTKERFNQGTLISLINKEIIKSNLQMQSSKMRLNSKKFIINSKKQLIDARFAIKIKKYPGEVIVKGDLNAPSVKLDAKSMITPEVEEKVGKEINRFLKKLF